MKESIMLEEFLKSFEDEELAEVVIEYCSVDKEFMIDLYLKRELIENAWAPTLEEATAQLIEKFNGAK